MGRMVQKDDPCLLCAQTGSSLPKAICSCQRPIPGATGVEVLSWVCSHFSSRPPHLSMHLPPGLFHLLAVSDSLFTSLTTAQSPDLSFAFRILERVFAFWSLYSVWSILWYFLWCLQRISVPLEMKLIRSFSFLLGCVKLFRSLTIVLDKDDSNIAWVNFQWIIKIKETSHWYICGTLQFSSSQ